MLLNLLIGVVTEAVRQTRTKGSTHLSHAPPVASSQYMDRARVQSTQQWEAHITQLMEESVASSRAAITRSSWLARFAKLVGPCSCRRGGGSSPNSGAAPSSPRGHRSAPGSVSPRLGTDIPSPRRPSEPGGGGGACDGGGGSFAYSAIAASQGAMEDPGIVLFAVLRDHCAELGGGEEPEGARRRSPPPREGRRGRSSVPSRGGRSSSSSSSASSSSESPSDGGGGRGQPRHRTSSPPSRRHHHHRGSRHVAPSYETCGGGDKGQRSLDRGFDALERRLGEQEASLNEVRRLLAQAVLALERRAEPELAPPQRRPPSIKFSPPALPVAAAAPASAASGGAVTAEVAPRTPQSEAGPSRPRAPGARRASLPGRGGRDALVIVVPEPPVEALADEDGGGDELPPPAGEAADSADGSPALDTGRETPTAAVPPAGPGT